MIGVMGASLREFNAALAAASPGARLLEAEGVTGLLTPRAPDRSLFNSVVYEDAAALEAALPGLAAEYEEGGIRAWTVWVPEADAAARAALQAAGHLLDASPRAMARELDGIERPAGPPPDRDSSLAELAEVNEAAYGTPPGMFTRTVEGAPAGAFNLYATREAGRAVAVLATIHHRGGDCGVYLVATAPAAQRRGLAAALMLHALADARDAGCATTTLQATRAGTPVYARLGYRDLGAIEMWERRRPAGGSAPAP
jgi:GNAT superfamily N-acetyltransferase